jgi:hypothetical protein
VIMTLEYPNEDDKEIVLLSKNNNHKVLASKSSPYNQWEAQEATSNEGHTCGKS